MSNRYTPMQNIPLPKTQQPEREQPQAKAQRITLYDAKGQRVFAGGKTVDDVRLAIRSAAEADHLDVADDIANHYDLLICRNCAADLQPGVDPCDRTTFRNVVVCTACRYALWVALFTQYP